MMFDNIVRVTLPASPPSMFERDKLKFEVPLVTPICVLSDFFKLTQLAFNMLE